jgi:hypothetical protein
MTAPALTELTGVQKAPRHEVAGFGHRPAASAMGFIGGARPYEIRRVAASNLCTSAMTIQPNLIALLISRRHRRELVVLALPPRYHRPLHRLPASPLLLPRSGLERSDFVRWPLPAGHRCRFWRRVSEA